MIDGDPDPNWAICDGRDTNGDGTPDVPDLRNRFIVGANENGATTLTNASGVVSGGASSVFLSENQIPDHKHEFDMWTANNYGAHQHHNHNPYYSDMVTFNSLIITDVPSGSGTYHQRIAKFQPGKADGQHVHWIHGFTEMWPDTTQQAVQIVPPYYGSS